MENQGGSEVRAVSVRNRQEAQLAGGTRSVGASLSEKSQRLRQSETENETEVNKLKHRSTYQLRSKTKQEAQNNNEATVHNQLTIGGSSGYHDELRQGPPLPEGNQEDPNKEIRKKRQPWTTEEMEELIWCYYYVNMKSTATEVDVYKLWRERNPQTRLNLDSTKLANQRRYLFNSDKVSEQTRRKIKNQVGENIRMEIQNKNTLTQKTQTTFNNSDTKSTGSEPAEEMSTLAKEIQAEWDKTRNMNINDRTRLMKINENAKIRTLLKQTNEAISQILTQRAEIDITDLNHLIYSVARVVIRRTTSEKHDNKQNQLKSSERVQEPPWAKRIQQKISKYRTELSLLTLDSNKDVNKSTKLKIKKIKTKYRINTHEDKSRVEEEIKQKIQAKAQRIKRYKKRTEFRKQNMVFENDTKKFYRYLNKENKTPAETPTPEDVSQYWSTIWEQEKPSLTDTEWVHEEEYKHRNDEIMQDGTAITTNEIDETLKKASNWKAGGPDQIANFWLKRLHTIHHHLAENFSKILSNQTEIPDWMCQGTTHLLYKKGDPRQAKNYRPITCLSVIYKLLTGTIANKIYKHLSKQNSIPKEQRGCIKGSLGCKEALLLNKKILEDAKRKNKNLSTAWIDYQKAYDSVPHKWILKTLEIYKIHPNIISLCENSMEKWSTQLIISNNGSGISTRMINIKSGIFQGDALSPLLFCISLFPLSSLLNTQYQAGYQLHKQEAAISHMLYMDDLKIFSKSDAELRSQLQKVHDFSTSISMTFGIEKCAMATLIRGKVTKTEHLELNEQDVIKQLEPGEAYKYLGIDENPLIANDSMKEKIRKEYLRRLRLILKSELSGKNKLHAIGNLAVPVAEYSFGIIDWTKAELQELDRRTRKLLTINGLLHPRADVDRLYVPRKEGGRGLRQLEAANENCIVNFAKYLLQKDQDEFVRQIVKSDTAIRSTKGIIKAAENVMKNHHKSSEDTNRDLSITEMIKTVNIKQTLRDELKEKWANKSLHGQYLKRIAKEGTNKEKTFGWLKRGRAKGETEAVLTAAQDQALRTKHYEKVVLKTTRDDKCRICKEGSETIDHIISACPQLAKKEYIDRHDKLCSNIHFNICQEYNIQTAEKWYNHSPAPVVNSENITIIYNQPVHTDREIRANRPDIIVKNYRTKECLLIDVTVPNDNNLINKEAEKKLKYRDLAIETARMWDMKTDIIPIVVGALGAIPNNLAENLHKIPGNQSEGQLQDIAIYGTARILRKVLP